MEHLNNITYGVRGAAFKVHTALGPGLLESAYEACLSYELRQIGHKVECQKPIRLIYNEVDMEVGYRIDMLVDDQIVVELKSVREITPVDEAQLLTYMRLSDRRLGLLMNFNVSRMKDGIRRYIL